MNNELLNNELLYCTPITSLARFQLCSNVYSAACFERRRRKVSTIQRRVAFTKNRQWYSGRNHRSANLPASPSRSDITAERVCNEESLLETSVEESFFSGINFIIVLISFRRTLRSILCACFLCHRRRIFLVHPLRYRSVSFY